MTSYLASPSFLWVALGITVLLIVVAVLWRNISWTARGITPPEMVASLQAGITGILPGHRNARYLSYGVGVLLLIVLVVWGLQGTLGTPSQSLQSPSLKTVWETTKDHWLWIFLTLAILYALTFFLPEEKKGVAIKSQWSIASLGVLLFVVFPFLGLFTGTGGHEQNRMEIPLESARPALPPPRPVVISPGGKSEPIAIPPDAHVDVTGNNFRVHNVYQDGHECAFGEACTDGPVASVYITNEDTKYQNIVSLTFVRK